MGGCQQVEHIVSACCVLLTVPGEQDANEMRTDPLRVTVWWVDPDSRISEPGQRGQGGLPGGGWPSRVSRADQEVPGRAGVAEVGEACVSVAP